MADAHETFWQDVQQEAAQELIERKRQQLLFIVVSGIAPTKRDLPVSKRDQTMVGDRSPLLPGIRRHYLMR
jgi:hypothetical protein